jgi:hypothetical protein
MLKQSLPELGLSLEQGTPSVPDDGRFHVVLATVIVFSSISKSKALSEYRRRRDRLLQESGQPSRPQIDPREILRREQAHFQGEALIAESYSGRRQRAMRKGGKAGRQGYK